MLGYLCQDADLGYAYSASLLHTTKKNQGGNTQGFLGVAPVTFDGLKLPELYFSENEIENVADTYDGETLIKNRATKANFIENADDHSILHLATHADVGDGDNPWIAFNDSKMYLKEIYATKNRADMVVLSGCNTSRGELKQGEGVMSLARGFFYSGAKSVVSTLWPVSDEAGEEILINFYKNLKQGDTKSKALQKAKLEYLATTEEEELRHPYYWAGFVVLGDNAPLTEKSVSLWVIVPVVVLVSGLCFMAFQSFSSPRKFRAPQAAA